MGSENVEGIKDGRGLGGGVRVRWGPCQRLEDRAPTFLWSMARVFDGFGL